MRPRTTAPGTISPPAARRAGFTIVEVVLAVGLLALGASVILGLLSFGASLARTASLRADAAAALPTVVAELEETLFPLGEDGSVGEPPAIVDRPVPGRSDLVYSVRAVRLSTDEDTGASDVAVAMPPLYRVEIELAWNGAGRRRALGFETLMARQVPFGTRLRRAFVENDRIDRPLPGGNP